MKTNNKLRELKEEVGVTNYQIAKDTGLTTASLSNWCNNKSEIPFSQLELINKTYKKKELKINEGKKI